jgi:hypothetical protein
MALREKIYLNRDNAIKLGLLADGRPIQTSGLTRIVAKLTDDDGNITTFDSDLPADADAFDWTSQTAQVSDTVVGILVMKLQDAGTPPAVGDDDVCTLIVYDDANPDGLVWDSPFPVQVLNT